MLRRGSSKWNDMMFIKHATPYNGIAGIIEKYRVQQITKIIQKNLKHKNFTLLEVGCEAGNLLRYISKGFPESTLVGMDISEKALEKAKKVLSQKVKLIKCDIRDQNLKLPIKKVDFLICSETLEHIPEVDKAIDGLARIADNKTTVIITVPSEKLKNLIKLILNKLKIFDLFFKGIEKDFSEWHLHNFSKKSILKLLSEKLKIIKCKKILFLHHIIIAQKL